MQTEFLIVGQGICGTFLSWYLQQAGRSFLMIDAIRPSSASRVAAGIINPVTGRRIVKTWMIDELMPFALEAYHRLGQELYISAIAEKNIIDFFPSLQMKMAFENRYAEDAQFISLPADQNAWQEIFRYEWGLGKIEPCYLVNLPDILPAWRKVLLSQQQLLEEVHGRLGQQRLGRQLFGRQEHEDHPEQRHRGRDRHVHRLVECPAIASLDHHRRPVFEQQASRDAAERQQKHRDEEEFFPTDGLKAITDATERALEDRRRSTRPRHDVGAEAR